MTIGGRHPAGKKKSRDTFEQIRRAIEVEDIELCRALMEEAFNNDNGFLDYQCVMTEHIKRTYAGRGNMVRGYTLFHYAARVGNVEVLQILFKKAPLEILRSCQPIHPIHLAITHGHVSCVNLIIDEARKGTTIFP